MNRLLDPSIPRLARLVEMVNTQEVGVGELVLADVVFVLDGIWLLVSRGVGEDESEAVLCEVLRRGAGADLYALLGVGELLSLREKGRNKKKTGKVVSLRSLDRYRRKGKIGTNGLDDESERNAVPTSRLL